MLNREGAEGQSSVYFIGMNWRDGGVVSDYLRQLAHTLVKNGHQVVLIVDKQRHDLEDHRANPAIYTWPSPYPWKLRDALFLWDLIRQYKPRCLIGVFRAVNLMMLVGWLMRVPHRIAWYRTTSNQSVFEIDAPSQVGEAFSGRTQKAGIQFDHTDYYQYRGDAG